jgi:hypothetical protein
MAEATQEPKKKRGYKKIECKNFAKCGRYVAGGYVYCRNCSNAGGQRNHEEKPKPAPGGHDGNGGSEDGDFFSKLWK